MSPDEVATICEKAAGIIREKGKFTCDLWKMSDNEPHEYIDGPVCAIGALSIASDTHQGDKPYGRYNELIDPQIMQVVASESPVCGGHKDAFDIYTYSDRPSTTAEDIAQMFERAAKSVTSD